MRAAVPVPEACAADDAECLARRSRQVPGVTDRFAAASRAIT